MKTNNHVGHVVRSTLLFANAQQLLLSNTMIARRLLLLAITATLPQVHARTLRSSTDDIDHVLEDLIDVVKSRDLTMSMSSASPTAAPTYSLSGSSSTKCSPVMFLAGASRAPQKNAQMYRAGSTRRYSGCFRRNPKTGTGQRATPSESFLPT